jgi:hypothetical protein
MSIPNSPSLPSTIGNVYDFPSMIISAVFAMIRSILTLVLKI